MMRPVMEPGDERQEGLRQEEQSRRGAEGSWCPRGAAAARGDTQTLRIRCPLLGPPRGTLTLESPHCQSAFRTGAQESRVCFLI